MNSDALALPRNSTLAPLVGLQNKRQAVESLINDYIIKHQLMDLGIGIAGFIPIPGAGLAAMVAAIAAQGPVIYQPMAGDIAAIYSRTTDAAIDHEVASGMIAGGALDVAADFGTAFLTEIAADLVQDIGLGGALAAIPVLGGLVGIALDIMIARTMTRRVGVMVALYCENGGEWIESRKKTYGIARDFVKASKKSHGSEPTIAKAVKAAKEVQPQQEMAIAALARALKDAGVPIEQLRASLLKQGYDATIVEAALRRIA